MVLGLSAQSDHPGKVRVGILLCSITSRKILPYNFSDALGLENFLVISQTEKLKILQLLGIEKMLGYPEFQH